jgi:hypothetical protein
MLNSFMNTLRRLFDQTDKPSGQDESVYSGDQLLIWAQGCMLEGLPDEFYEARLDCERTPLADGQTEVSVRHTYRLTSTSEPERFWPADDLYPVQCVEKVLKDRNWQKAALVFSAGKASFGWE